MNLLEQASKSNGDGGCGPFVDKHLFIFMSFGEESFSTPRLAFRPPPDLGREKGAGPPTDHLDEF